MKKLTQLSYIQKLLTEIVDVFFPPSDEEKLLKSVKTSTLTGLYLPRIFQKTTYLCSYHEKIIKAAIKENKFHTNHKAAKHLGYILGKWASTQSSEVLFVPIPLGKKRLRQRGHNQVETILSETAPSITVSTKILRRRIDTLPQTKLNKRSRKENIHDVFEFIGVNMDLSKYSQIVLVDDVVTTGATLDEARATLAPHLPPNTKLTCLAIAH